MKVYHITYSPSIKTACLYFYGCNFRCSFCIRKKSMHDIHLENEPKGKLRMLGMGEVLRIIDGLGAERAIMMGYEPTVDPELPDLAERLSDSGVQVSLLTNGYELSGRLLKSVEKACLSIKAYSQGLHRRVTGKGNRRVLENFRKVHDLGIPLSAESIYIPGLIDLDEIMRIARFISSIDPEIPYHIDAYIPVDDRWRAPTAKEITNAALEAEKYLKNVSYLCGDERLEHEVIQVV